VICPGALIATLHAEPTIASSGPPDAALDFGGIGDIETAPLEIHLVHSQRIGPSARLLRDFLLNTERDQ
jgi:hypothetical protein